MKVPAITLALFFALGSTLAVVAAAQVVEAPARAAQLAQVVEVPLALVAVLLVAVLAQAAVPGMEQSLVLAQAPAVLLRVEQPVWVQAQG
jgi:hypothetical protein